MSKAILVMDMPESCAKCDLSMVGSVNFCAKTHMKIEQNVIYDGKKPDWCPLKEVPKKKESYLSINNVKEYYEGWNECLDKILKE